MLGPDASVTPLVPARRFLGWHRPWLELVIDELTSGAGSGVLDLADRMVVVPTRQSGRRLREALAEWAGERGTGVFPPRVLTTEAFLSELRPAGRPVATTTESLLAWIGVLRSIRFEDFPHLFPRVPARPDFPWALRLARSWQEVRRMLGDGGGSMLAAAEKLQAGEHLEAPRWADLARLETLYLERLAAHGRDDDSVARQQAAGRPVLPAGVAHVDWIGVTDPPQIAIAAAERLGIDGLGVTVWVAAPDDHSWAFDAWGRPDPRAWNEWRDLPLPLGRIHLAAGPAEQAALVRSLAAGHPDPASTLGLGVADAEVAEALVTAAGDQVAVGAGGFSCHRPDGLAASDHELWHLLTGWARLQREKSYCALGRWLRFPTVAVCLRRRSGVDPGCSQADLLVAWDDYLNSHLPCELSDGQRFLDPVVNAVSVAAEQLLKDFDSRPLPEAVGDLLTELFEGRRFSSAAPEAAPFIELAHEIGDWCRQAAEAARFAGAPIANGGLLGVVLEMLRHVRLDASDRPPDAVDINGWLELGWDPAPHLIVAGLNDGVLPEVVIGHAYLPDSMRLQLGLSRTNAARLARDAHQLHALLASRASTGGRVDVVVGRRSLAGDALRPSRLLFFRPDAELPERVTALFGDDRLPEVAPSPAWCSAWRLQLPPPRAINHLSATGIRAYLACPFRFFLKQGLHMEEVEPDPRELDARQFGELCHAALRALAADDSMRRCSDEALVADFLREEARKAMRASLGESLTVPLRVQLAAAEKRLAAAATWHAASVREGWEIMHAEIRFEDLLGHPFWIDGMEIRGRIDRIETRGNDRRIIDFKTNDSPRRIHEAHLGPCLRSSSQATARWPGWQLASTADGRCHAWRDLQLPLYALAAREAWGTTPEVGYFHLAKAAGECRYEFWPDLTPELLAQALACVQAVIRAVRQGEFWPPRDVGRRDEFAWLFPGGVEAAVDPSALIKP